jgi:hypothetical protein
MSKPGREIEGVPDHVKDLLRAAKPYKGGNDTLWGLHELNNRDKHRLLITAVSAVNKFGMEVGGRELQRMFPHSVRFQRGALRPQFVWWPRSDKRFLGAKKGDPVFSIQGNFEDNKNIKLAFDVALTEPQVVEGKPLLEFLSAATKVVNSLVSEFAPFLL